jgi:hypothetical protein
MRVGNYAEEIKKILSTEALAPQVNKEVSEAILGVRN